MPKVNSIRLPKTPLQAEHSRQVKKDLKNSCRHLKQIYTDVETALDHANDETIEIVHTYCKQCNQELTEADLRERNKILERFKRLKR